MVTPSPLAGGPNSGGDDRIFPLQDQELEVMGKTIEQGSGHRRLAEDLAPAGELQVAGGADQNRQDRDKRSRCPAAPVSLLLKKQLGWAEETFPRSCCCQKWNINLRVTPTIIV